MSIRTNMTLVIMLITTSIHGFGSEDLKGFDDAVHETKQLLVQAWPPAPMREVNDVCRAMGITAFSTIFVFGMHYGVHYICATSGECPR